jgi:very-short-patch-repair endonuclease
VDFACVPAKLVIEVDGGQHDEQWGADEARDAWPTTRGYRVLRFWNHDVLRTPGVVAEEIRRVLRERLHA